MIAAAVRVVSTEGFAALTMRRVAAELGGGASSLYWHVRDKGQLTDLVVDQLVAEIAVPGRGAWQERLAGFAHNARTVLRRYPGLAQHILERGAAGLHAVQMAEAVLAIFRQAGLGDSALWPAYHTLLAYINGFVLGETWPRPSGTGRRAATSAYVSSLPEARFPVIHAASRAASWDDDARFGFGLDHLIYAFGHFPSHHSGADPDQGGG